MKEQDLKYEKQIQLLWKEINIIKERLDRINNRINGLMK